MKNDRKNDLKRPKIAENDHNDHENDHKNDREDDLKRPKIAEQIYASSREKAQV